MSVLRITKKIFKILDKKQKRAIFIIATMMLFGGVLESVSISLVLPLITAVMDTEGWDKKWYAKILCNTFSIQSQRMYIECVLVILIVVFVLKNLYLLLECYVQNSFIGKSRFDMQKNLMISYTHKPYSFFIMASSGEILRIVTQDTNQTFMLLNNLLRIYTELVVSVVLGITVFIMSPKIAVWMIVILLIEMTAIALVIKPVMKKMGERIRRENAASNKWILQTVNGIKSVKVAKKERFFESQYEKHAKQQVEIEKINNTLDNLPRLLIEAFTVAGVLFVILMFVLSGIELADILPQLSAFVVAAIRLLPSSNRISSSMNMCGYLEGSLDNILNVVNGDIAKESVDCSKGIRESVLTNNADIRMKFNDTVLLDKVSFSYGNDEVYVLEDASMTVKKGQSIGIVGSSGAGKSTCVDIMLGLLIPQKGEVKADGVNINLEIDKWLEHIAYIPQQIFLIDDTIRANVAFGFLRSEVSDERVWEALKEAQLDEFVRKLPDSLDTRIGEQGVRLSGGQRQRIGIARALYGDADILIFDEATSALDNETESAIMESIDKLKGKRTLIIIAHRLTTIMNCDVIYKVEDKKITAIDKSELSYK